MEKRKKKLKYNKSKGYGKLKRKERSVAAVLKWGYNFATKRKAIE